MNNRFSVSASPTRKYRTDHSFNYKGFTLRSEDVESTNEYRQDLKERVTALGRKVCIESGPLPGCKCRTCERYRERKAVAPDHDASGCYCPVCAKRRYKKNVENYGPKRANKLRANGKEKTL